MVGGLIGNLSVPISGLSSTAAVVGLGGGTSLGGLAGSLRGGTLNPSFFGGTVTGTAASSMVGAKAQHSDAVMNNPSATSSNRRRPSTSPSRPYTGAAIVVATR